MLPAMGTEMKLAGFERGPAGIEDVRCSELNRHALLPTINLKDSKPKLGPDRGALLWLQTVLNGD